MLSNGAPTQIRNGAAAGNRISVETPFRHASNGNLSVPKGLGPQNGTSNGQPHMGPIAPAPRFDGPRSPPGKQNTSHVPCKFYRQGACQAGKACPFSHDLSSTSDNVCKYFAKGNCKFGPKCANVHVLPNGQRVNYHKGAPLGIGSGHLNIGGRVNPDPYHGQSSLTNSLFRANMVPPPSPFGPPFPQFPSSEESYPALGARRPSMDIAPTIDTSYASHPGSAYGSPREEDTLSRFGLGLSPVPTKGLSVLDAPLPASFDSNGVSWIARNGPVAASVPAKFGLESPPSSLSLAKEGRTSEALKNLHSSAFGDDTRDRFNGAASPPVHPAEEFFGKRVMHSQRFAKQKIMSSSLPKSSLAIDKDWDADFTFEEDYLPDNLKELLTPQEKARRGSRNAEDEGRPTHSGSGTPVDASSKFGSPSNASPSRWGHLFQRQRDEEEKVSRASVFGHVGSPLRNSSLHPGSSPIQRVVSRSTTGSGDASPYVASPPRQSSMSIISQQLQRTRLSRAESSSSENSSLYPTPRVTSAPIGFGVRKTDMDRQVSNSSINAGRFTTPIDEEHGDFVFSMEEEEDREREKEKEKRNSGGWSYPPEGRGPNLGAISGQDEGSNGSGTNKIGAGRAVIAGIFGVGR